MCLCADCWISLIYLRQKVAHVSSIRSWFSVGTSFLLDKHVFTHILLNKSQCLLCEVSHIDNVKLYTASTPAAGQKTPHLSPTGSDKRFCASWMEFCIIQERHNIRIHKCSPEFVSDAAIPDLLQNINRLNSKLQKEEHIHTRSCILVLYFWDISANEHQKMKT